MNGLQEILGRAAGQHGLFLIERQVGEIRDAVHLGNGVVDGADEPFVDLLTVVGVVQLGNAS